MYLCNVHKKNLHNNYQLFKALLKLLSVTFLATILLNTPLKAQAEKYASIVIDAKTGKTLHSRHANSYRYPASLTKVMTLYVLFEELEAGRLSLNSRLKVSRYAASRPPTKLGLRTGSTIRVKDAMRALITRSANDAAVVIAENISGSVPAFARRMTKTARAMGMKRTTFKNPSGLPNRQQKTTARDMAILGMAIQDRFPRYYKYFKTRSFKYGKRRYRNHNKLLGRIKGVDGIKTGYTRASGFNLLTNAKLNRRHVVAVVMGGRSGRSRDRHMASLLKKNIKKASRGNRTRKSIRVASFSKAKLSLAETKVPLPSSKPIQTILAYAEQTPSATQAPAAQSITHLVQRIESGQPKSFVTASLQQNAHTPSNITTTALKKDIAQPESKESKTQSTNTLSKSDKILQEHTLIPMSALLKETASQKIKTKPTLHKSTVQIPPSKPVIQPLLQADSAEEKLFVIQIGAVEQKNEAKKLLDTAKTKANIHLKKAQPYTETVDVRGTTLWRARFAGFQNMNKATKACQALKQRDFKCLAIRL